MSKDKATTGNDPSEDARSARKTAPATPGEKSPDEPASCGVVMPISSIDGCSAEHWIEVKAIIFETVRSISSPVFTVKLVSDDETSGVIQKRIVQNIYSSDIVICDVSAKNPNVMFELGMRLAFDKATIIVKDDKTDYSFDTGIIEHIPYPRDLRFNKIVNFKNALAEKLLATYKSAKSDLEHSTFLKNFGTFQIAKISESILPADKMALTMIQELQEQISALRYTLQQSNSLEEKRIRSQMSDIARETKELGKLRIRNIIEDTIRTNPKFDVASLIDNESFMEYIITTQKIGTYFQTKSDLIECINRIVIDIKTAADSQKWKSSK